MRRDDPIPAPWTKKGMKRSEELGLEMQVCLILKYLPDRELQIVSCLLSWKLFYYFNSPILRPNCLL